MGPLQEKKMKKTDWREAVAVFAGVLLGALLFGLMALSLYFAYVGAMAGRST